MDYRERVQGVLDQFAASIGLERLKINEEGRACLIFGDAHTVYLDLDEDQGLLALACRLGAPASGEEASIHALLLRANGFWRELAVMFGLDPESGEVIQLRQLHVAGLDLPSFQRALGSYLAVLDDWRRVVAGDTAAAGKVQAPQPAAEPIRVEGYWSMIRG
jgi:hypothetical protein